MNVSRSSPPRRSRILGNGRLNQIIAEGVGMSVMPFRLLISRCLSISLTLPLCVGFSGSQEPARRQPQLGLAVRIHGKTLPRGIPGNAHWLIRRNQLKVVDDVAAGGFTAIWIISEEEAGAIKVDLSVTYGDVQGRIFWKDNWKPS